MWSQEVSFVHFEKVVLFHSPSCHQYSFFLPSTWHSFNNWLVYCLSFTMPSSSCQRHKNSDLVCLVTTHLHCLEQWLAQSWCLINIYWINEFSFSPGFLIHLKFFSGNYPHKTSWTLFWNAVVFQMNKLMNTFLCFQILNVQHLW